MVCSSGKKDERQQLSKDPSENEYTSRPACRHHVSPFEAYVKAKRSPGVGKDGGKQLNTKREVYSSMVGLRGQGKLRGTAVGSGGC
jgi:hypothetical protein